MYGTAMSGRCEKRQSLADSALDLSATIVMLPCRGDTAMLKKVFEPLGYEVDWESGFLDERFPEWGNSCYVNLTIRGKTRLQDILRHIYVLIPVFDCIRRVYITHITYLPTGMLYYSNSILHKELSQAYLLIVAHCISLHCIKIAVIFAIISPNVFLNTRFFTM
jgi:hypothetical protein